VFRESQGWLVPSDVELGGVAKLVAENSLEHSLDLADVGRVVVRPVVEQVRRRDLAAGVVLGWALKLLRR
jgi:hypothetical protein